jgi:hypothetical protein
MTPMEALAARFRFNEKFLERAVKDFTQLDWILRIDGSSSHAWWLLGHLAVSRRVFLRALGVARPEADWEQRFAKGSRPEDGPGLPSPQVIEADLHDSGGILEECLKSFSALDAGAPFTRKLPDGSSTKEGAAHFYLWHETYHLGQLGILRRACGKPGIA